MTMIRRSLALAGILLLSFSSSAFAHPGLGHVHGYFDGLSHPLSGLDHILAMIAVGLLAARIGGQGAFVIPANDYVAYSKAIYRKLLREITGPGIS
jgi:urease accessory protein